MAVSDIANLPMVRSAASQSVDLSGAQVLALSNAAPVQVPSMQGGLPLLVGDKLAVTAFSNRSGMFLTAVVRTVDASGNPTARTITWEYDAAYTAQTFVLDLPNPGTFQAVSLYWNGTNLNNAWMYATAGITNIQTGTQPYVQLVADYLSTIGQASWPGRGIKPPTEGAGFTYTLGAGAVQPDKNWLVRVPTGVRWTVHWFGFDFVTSSAPGDRQIITQALWGLFDTQEWTGAILPAVPASTTVHASYDAFGEDWQNGGVQYRCPLPRPFYLHGCDSLLTAITGIDTADQVNNFRLGITEHYLPDQLACD